MVEITKFHKFIVANWKLNGSVAFIDEYISKLSLNNKDNNSKCVIICPPFTFINKIHIENLFVGAQNCSVYDKGAYTGEVSTKMLRDIGCHFCIVGHSERRNLFNESNETIRIKISQCILQNIIPIVCIGESLKQRKENLTKEIIQNQLSECIPEESNYNNTLIAYEPLWAIGTGIIPKLNDISEIQSLIKNNISKTKNYKVLYGGSVKASNSKDIINLD